MTILAIDPSIGNPCGLVVMEHDRIVYARAIMSDKRWGPVARSHRVTDLVRAAADEWRPDILAIEYPPYVRDPEVHFVLSALVGSIRYACRDVPCLLPKPTECKKALTGKGTADKALMVSLAAPYLEQWEFRTKPEREAIADAVGAALVARRAHSVGRLIGGGNATNNPE